MMDGEQLRRKLQKEFAELGADVSAQNQDDQAYMAIDLAVAQCEPREAMKVLAEMGVGINRAFVSVVEQGNVEAMKGLVELGADVNTQHDIGWTVLHAAAGHGQVETVKGLADLGADVNAKAQNGCTALHSAALKGHV